MFANKTQKHAAHRVKGPIYQNTGSELLRRDGNARDKWTAECRPRALAVWDRASVSIQSITVEGWPSGLCFAAYYGDQDAKRLLSQLVAHMIESILGQASHQSPLWIREALARCAVMHFVNQKEKPDLASSEPWRMLLFRRICRVVEEYLLAVFAPKPIGKPICKPMSLTPEKRRETPGLSKEQEQVLRLFDDEQLSYQEISDRLGIPMGTVKSRLSRGRAIRREKVRNRLAR